MAEENVDIRVTGLENFATSFIQNHYKDYDTDSLRQLINIHRQNSDEWTVKAFENAFADRLKQEPIKEAPSAEFGDEHYVPLKDRGLIDKTLTTATVGAVFTKISEGSREEAQKVCELLKNQGISTDEFDPINNELEALAVNYACAKADGVDFPGK